MKSGGVTTTHISQFRSKRRLSPSKNIYSPRKDFIRILKTPGRLADKSKYQDNIRVVQEGFKRLTPSSPSEDLVKLYKGLFHPPDPQFNLGIVSGFQRTGAIVSAIQALEAHGAIEGRYFNFWEYQWPLLIIGDGRQLPKWYQSLNLRIKHLLTNTNPLAADDIQKCSEIICLLSEANAWFVVSHLARSGSEGLGRSPLAKALLKTNEDLMEKVRTAKEQVQRSINKYNVRLGIGRSTGIHEVFNHLTIAESRLVAASRNLSILKYGNVDVSDPLVLVGKYRDPEALACVLQIISYIHLTPEQEVVFLEQVKGLVRGLPNSQKAIFKQTTDLPEDARFQKRYQYRELNCRALRRFAETIAKGVEVFTSSEEDELIDILLDRFIPNMAENIQMDLRWLMVAIPFKVAISGNFSQSQEKLLRKATQLCAKRNDKWISQHWGHRMVVVFSYLTEYLVHELDWKLDPSFSKDRIWNTDELKAQMESAIQRLTGEEKIIVVSQYLKTLEAHIQLSPPMFEKLSLDLSQKLAGKA